jgi:hypothetical protein
MGTPPVFKISQIFGFTLCEIIPLYQSFAQGVYRNEITSIDNQFKLFGSESDTTGALGLLIPLDEQFFTFL